MAFRPISLGPHHYRTPISLPYMSLIYVYPQFLLISFPIQYFVFYDHVLLPCSVPFLVYWLHPPPPPHTHITSHDLHMRGQEVSVFLRLGYIIYIIFSWIFCNLIQKRQKTFKTVCCWLGSTEWGSIQVALVSWHFHVTPCMTCGRERKAQWPSMATINGQSKWQGYAWLQETGKKCDFPSAQRWRSLC